jgi:hypothetical protein
MNLSGLLQHNIAVSGAVNVDRKKQFPVDGCQLSISRIYTAFLRENSCCQSSLYGEKIAEKGRSEKGKVKKFSISTVGLIND